MQDGESPVASAACSPRAFGSGTDCEKTVLFAMMQGELGHLHCAIGLADRLRSAGYKVEFVGLPQDAARVRAFGFAYRVIGRELRPATKAPDEQAQGRRSLLGRVSQAVTGLRDELRKVKRLFDELATRPEDCGVFACHLLIADEMSPWGAIFALRMGIPVILLATGFPDAPNLPPSHSSYIPGDGATSRIRVLGMRLRAKLRRTAV